MKGLQNSVFAVPAGTIHRAFSLICCCMNDSMQSNERGVKPCTTWLSSWIVTPLIHMGCSRRTCLVRSLARDLQQQG